MKASVYAVPHGRSYAYVRTNGGLGLIAVPFGEKNPYSRWEYQDYQSYLPLYEGKGYSMKKQTLSVPQQHQLRIAKKTLKLSDVGAMVLGGMSKEEARDFLHSVGYTEKEIQKIEKG